MTFYKCKHKIKCPTCGKLDKCGTILTIISDGYGQSHFNEKHPDHPFTNDIESYFEVIE